MYPGAGVSPLAEATVPPEQPAAKPERTRAQQDPVGIPDAAEASGRRRPSAARKRETQQEPAE
jgi:hypothetical protein